MFLQLKLQKKFDTYVTAWNPHNSHLSIFWLHHSTTNDPCSLASPSIFSSNYSVEYEELVNFVQRHTICSESTCLCKKVTSVQCRYGFLYDLQVTSPLFIDPNGCKTYNLARNDSLLNIYNPTILSIWRANVDFQLVLSRHVVLKYISKYPSKVEPKLESYHAILSHLDVFVTSECIHLYILCIVPRCLF